MKQMYLVLYYIKKIVMNLKEKINELFAKHNISLTAEEAKVEEVVEVKQMAEAILEDGTSIYTDSDAWAVEVRVFGKDADGNEVALPDGEYKLADGTTITVMGGIVAEIATASEEMPEEEVAPVEQAVETTSTEEVSALLSIVANLEKEIASLKGEKTELAAQVAKLSAQPAAPSIKEVKQSKQKEVSSKPYSKMSAEERYLYNLHK